MAVYVDTSAWIALHERREEDHAAAKRAVERLARANEPLITGWHTLTELADGLARHYDQAKASQVLEQLLASPRVRVVASEPHVARGLEILRTRTDWNVDLSDCLSFALMEAHGIQRAFTYDRGFKKPGFELLG
ncbi:MAG TPA: PIN domain-containing protein [Candidatus Thermoplasmatota archaeon]|nr:PIN domain-containing protein [Candidatus Thermoplasmatota archaeon]